MKYKDKLTTRLEANHSNQLLDRDPWGNDISNRASRRKEERRFKQFTLDVYRYLEKDWWDSVDEETKKKLYNEWFGIIRLSNSGIYNTPDFKKWITQVRKDIKPNVLLYRDKILNKILE